MALQATGEILSVFSDILISCRMHEIDVIIESATASVIEMSLSESSNTVDLLCLRCSDFRKTDKDKAVRRKILLIDLFIIY